MTRRRGIALAAAAAVVAVVLVLALSSGGERSSLPEAGSSFGATATATGPRKGTTLIDALAPVFAQGRSVIANPAAERRPRADTVPGLPVPTAQAAARLFLVGFPGTGPDRRVLGRLAGHEWGGVVLEQGNGTSRGQVATMVARIRRAALARGHEAPLVAAAQIGDGANAVPVGPGLQSELRAPAEAQREAQDAAGPLREAGVHAALAPVADVGAAGGPWEAGAFSDDPTAVAAMSTAAVAGWKAGSVAPGPGHFPGEGAASGDPSLKPSTVGLSLDELRTRDLRPFAAVSDNVPAIQLSSATYVAYDGVTPATLLPEVVTLLRKDIGFRGVVVSGDLAAASLATGRPVAEVAVAALKAGCDLLWVPGDAADQEAAWRAVVRALRSGDVPAARVAEALGRDSVLRASAGVR